MTVRLVNSSAVVVAHHFNPSITSQIWLVDNGILLREEFESGSVFTDMFAQAQTRRFHLLIVPDKCQITLAPEVGTQPELIVERIVKLVRTLPHTPYRAAGMNFVWHFVPDRQNGAIDALCRRLFYVSESPLHGFFDVENARFGGYLSKDSLGCRLNLDIKPILADAPKIGEPTLLEFAFNYHVDVAGHDDPVAEIEHVFMRWNEAREESCRVVQDATGEQGS